MNKEKASKVVKVSKTRAAKASKAKTSRRPRQSSGKKTREPQTMEDLLKLAGYQLRGWKRGDVVEGEVTEKGKRAIYINIGGKAEGAVIDREMKASRDYIKDLKVGDKVTAVITQPENERGQTLLSLKRAAADSLWLELEKSLKTGESVKVRGLEVNKGGLVVDAKGVQGFIPASQFASRFFGKISELTGRQLVVRPIEVDREQNRLVFSEKEVSEAALLKAQGKALKKIKPGEIFEGTVTGVMPFGLFVKVEVIQKEKVAKASRPAKARDILLEGLVHISEISWEKVEDAGKFYKERDKVKVKVLATDRKSGRLNLSIKQLQPDPWEGIEKRYPADAKVKGEVTRLVPFGAFVHLAPGIEGLVHISKIPAERSIKPGEKVDCYIESVDKEGRRLSLGLVLKEKPVGYK